MASVRLHGISKIYPGDVHAVQDVDLEIADGEFIVLVGPSGCGKSTTLRMIAGLESITSGTLHIGDRPGLRKDLLCQGGKEEVLLLAELPPSVEHPDNVRAQLRLGRVHQ